VPERFCSATVEIVRVFFRIREIAFRPAISILGHRPYESQTFHTVISPTDATATRMTVARI